MAKEGMFLYYFYDRGKLTSVEVDEYKFDRLMKLDKKMYNNERRAEAHKATYVKTDRKSYYKKIDMENDDGPLLDEKQRGMLESVTEQATAEKRLSVLSEEDRETFTCASLSCSFSFPISYKRSTICISSRSENLFESSVLSAVAEIECENILEQTMNGCGEKARQGKWNGGPMPYGYILKDDTI